MNSIEIIYAELADLDSSIEMYRLEIKKLDEDMVRIFNKIADTNFSASEGTQMYLHTQRFLQERRLKKAHLEELEVMYESLGGRTRLNNVKNRLSIGCIDRAKPSKYNRTSSYFKNFDEDIKEEILSMYHIREEK